MGAMSTTLRLLSAIALASVLAGGCAGNPIPPYRQNVALWASKSAEFTAVALQTYGVARGRLDGALDDPKWTACLEQPNDYEDLPPAIIVDLDETVLDNRPFQMRLIREGLEFDEEMWNEWVRESRVEAIPGAAEFLKYAADRGVEVFYVTNRVHEVEAATRQNLAYLGLPLNEEFDTLLTKKERPEWTSDKANRRALIASSHRVVLILGDNLGDFTSEKPFLGQGRRKVAYAHTDMWGEKWFMLPNPLYGSWVAATRASEDSSD
jgi:acid phosphatase